MGARKCSKCGKTGHNSRTCRNASLSSGKIMRLFGVELAKFDDDDDESKLNNSSEAEIISSSSSDEDLKQTIHGATTQVQRKKGVPWSEEEHRLFLLGLEKLGKGNWRGISRNFVTTRTSTQVASHAQKYFLRINNNSTKINKLTPTIISMVRRNEARILPEGPYFCSLELSLAAPAAAVLERLPAVMLWKKQYVVKNCI